MSLVAALATLVLSSPAFAAGHAIPRAYTCDGRDVSPPLRWTAPPRGTQSFAITVVDVDAGGFVHWRARGIPASARGLAAGEHATKELPNSFGHTGYSGPCPPRGSKPHRYVFRLEALEAGARVLAAATLVGTYHR